VKCLELTVKLNDDEYCVGDSSDPVQLQVLARGAGRTAVLKKSYTGKLVYDKQTFNFTIPAGTYSQRGNRQVFSMSRRPPSRRGTHAVWAYVNPKSLGVADTATFTVDRCDDDEDDCGQPEPCRRRRRRQDQDQDQDRRRRDAVLKSSIRVNDLVTVDGRGHIVKRSK
jgi:hypothetical protein